MAPKSKAHDPTATPPLGELPYRFALSAPKPLIALTRDPQLLATLKKVADPAHEVSAAGSEVDLSAALMAHHAGVAVIDCAAIVSPLATLTERLHAQFPDLVLIVAGGADEQGALAAQITDGSVYRFLHKPVSEQRVRLFVEAAWRRHAEGDGVLRAVRTAPPARPAGGAKLWLALAAAIVIGAPLAWLTLRTPPEGAAHRAPSREAANRAAAADDATLESLLTRADRALAAGALVAPPEENAADLFRQALQRNARDPRAVNGLEQVIEALLAGSEQQLQQQHLDAAQQLVDQARAINPKHPRVAFLAAQIGAQRERAVLGKAQRAAAGGNVAGALAALDDAAHDAHGSPLVAEARNELAQKQADTRVADLVGRGRDALDHGHLLEPPEDNAHFYIEAARALAPNDPGVQQATQDLVAHLADQAHQALTAKNPDAVDTWANAAGDAGADAAQVASLHEQAQQLRSATRADVLAHLTHAFNQSLDQGHILEPANDSARFYLAQLTQADAASSATQLAHGAYRTRVLAEARSALHAQDFSGTRRWLAEARAAGVDGADVATLEAALTAAQDEAQQASSYVSESTLTRTRYVAPEFPAAALQRSIGGWVDLQFVVGTDGAVGDVAVVGAEPAGIFEQAALDAVRRWHYRPVTRDDHAVAQRARVRVRFAVQK